MGQRDRADPTRVRYLVLAVACSLAVLTYVQRQGFVAGSPYVKEDLGLNDEHLVEQSEIDGLSRRCRRPSCRTSGACGSWSYRERARRTSRPRTF